MRKRVIVVFVDALSSDYLNEMNTPFLSKLKDSSCYRNINPMFAFQGIGASIFTGTSINKHRIWCDWILDFEPREQSALFSLLLRLSDVASNDRLCKDLRHVIYKAFNFEFSTPNLIPTNMIPYFTTSQRRTYTSPNSIEGIPTLFDVLKENKIEHVILGLSGVQTDEKIFRKALKCLHQSFDLLFIKFSSLDSKGHKYGPHTDKMNKAVHQIDTYLMEIFHNLNEIQENTQEKFHVIIFSDHGMSSVNRIINIYPTIKGFPLKLGEDYVCFIDSTLIRFWYFNDRAKNTLIEELKSFKSGKLLTSSDLEDNQLSGLNSQNGMLIFALDEGVIFHPDYYRRHQPPKGMHGYFSPSNNPVFIHSDIEVESKETWGNKMTMDMTDITPTILHILGIPIPKTCEGKPLKCRSRGAD